ncbi:DUF4034 domain-containing protein [Kitasatospora aureofaciens]|uniref:DUF4034 domain-containing protein n=1 Tax=Kitasatospora aureofaciens TaxID=1894 RepID=UPI001C464128|nr:DUF4034 domain-containing protein [Kitasatospora aureofaciens]MBV6702660.1 DUF4034 domain-containing protein [Kitasatospora aureofaciens]
MTHLILLVLVIAVSAAVTKARKSKAGNPAQPQVDAAAYGLVPRDRLDPRRAGPPPAPHHRKESQAIADAAWAGNWKPAAAYVEAAGQDWDERWSRLSLLDSIANEDDGWLKAWRAADPGSCDAATLEANRMVHAAWAIRGSKYAHEVPEEDMNTFRAMLPAAIEAAKRASLLDPANPAPWVVMVTTARGAQYEPEQFEELWRGLVERAPFHYEAHWQGMQYWCAKWFGSDQQMMDFAERAMDAAPAGSPLPGIYLHALSELEKRKTHASTLGSDEGKKRLRQAAAALAQVRPDNERLTPLRHLLADYAMKAELYDVALEQFRAIGPWCGCKPWTDADDPVAAFDLARGTAVRLSGAQPLPPELRPKAVQKQVM